jgi:hypothetical protein
MNKLLITAAAATMLIAAAPAFATSPTDDAEWDRSPYPSAGECHFVLHRMITPNVLHRMITPNGRVILERQQICE